MEEIGRTWFHSEISNLLITNPARGRAKTSRPFKRPSLLDYEEEISVYKVAREVHNTNEQHDINNRTSSDRRGDSTHTVRPRDRRDSRALTLSPFATLAALL